MEEEIKSCPFCGSEADLLHSVEMYTGDNRCSYVQCKNEECGARTKSVSISYAYSSDLRVIELWNQRAAGVRESD